MAANLGDSFSDSFKENFASQNIKVGSVIRCHVDDTNPPKIKRFVIVGISEDKLMVGALYFNTEINPNIFKTEELKDLHLPFESTEREYIDHDCFLDCSAVVEKNHQWLNSVIANDPANIIGELSPEDLKRARETVKKARTIPIKMKKKYRLFL